MKKIKFYHIFLSLMLMFIIVGCEKDKQMEVVYQDVVFGVDHVAPLTLKDNGDELEDWYCQEDLTPVKAHIVIDGEDYWPEVFFVGDKLYTQSIKLAVDDGTTDYTVTRFVLLGEDDMILMATPAAGSPFADYVGQTVDFTFTVNAFEKAEVFVEVLCFVPAQYSDFGFTWFNINQIIVNELWFFGDICAISYPGPDPGPGNGEEPGDPSGETAWGGDYEGDGAAWWYYFDTDGPRTQVIYAGQNATDGSVTYDSESGQLIIDLGSYMILQDGGETVKIQGYNEGELPTSRPSSGGFTYKGNELVVDVDHYDYFAIHLDVLVYEEAYVGTKSFDTSVFAGSLYEYVVNGIQMDMPAIFKIHVEKNNVEVPHSPFSNIDLDVNGEPLPIAQQTLNANGELDGTNKPVSVKYPVTLYDDNQLFTYALYLWVPDMNGNFSFELFYTFTSENNGPLLDENGDVQLINGVPGGEIGPLTFVLGNCLYEPADLNLEWTWTAIAE